MKQIAVIGIGQSLRGDDAAGLEAIRQWREKFPETAGRPEVRIEACELPGLELLDLLNETNAAILVDAVQSSAMPGTIHRINEEKLLSFSSNTKSAHGWGVAETLKLRHHLMEGNPAIRVIGIESNQMEIGAELSGAIRAAMPSVCEIIEEEIGNFLNN
jgi:hydrogenase maturation protease